MLAVFHVMIAQLFCKDRISLQTCQSEFHMLIWLTDGHTDIMWS